MTNHEQWLAWLEGQQQQDYYKRILDTVQSQEKKYVVTPDSEYRMRPFQFSNIDDIKVIITDTEPKFEPYAADGLAWSTLDEPNRRLGLLYKKLYDEIGVTYNQLDNAKDRWEQQGILLLNMELTRILNQKSTKSPWLPFTLKVIQYFLNQKQPRAFLFLDEQTISANLSFNDNHLIIFSNVLHPTFSTTSMFFSINQFITRHYDIDIDWS